MGAMVDRAVRIDVLGGFAVHVDDRRVTPDAWGRRHAAWLVKLLALSPGRRLHREQVLDVLWPDLDVDAAAPRLHKAAHYARRALADLDRPLEVQGESLVLLPAVDVAIDAFQFREAAIAALANGSPVAANAALAGYGGELLPDDRYEPWTSQLRDALGALHLDLLRQAGRWEEVLDVDPADEAAHLALARSYAARGERAAALRQLDRLEEVLERELGVQPGAEAARLRRELSTPGEAAAASATTSPPARTPRTRYANAGGHDIAYQVVGDGPVDVVFVPGFVSNVELQWEHPAIAAFFARISRFARLIVFDKRATGLSERSPLETLPTLEDRMDDVRAVMDAAGSKRATLFGISEGGPMAVLFAATYPDRVERLVLYGTFAAEPFAGRGQTFARDARAWWGSGSAFGFLAPGWARDHGTRRFFARYERNSATPAVAAGIIALAEEIDARPALAGVSAPTLVLHRTGDDAIRVDRARELAAGICGARLVELPGVDHLAYVDGDQLLDHVEAFVSGGLSAAPPATRILTTILFADVVDSTGRAQVLGDRAWRDVLAAVVDDARGAVSGHRGELRSVTGDGLMATFDGPARAVRCAGQLHDAAGRHGLRLRCGVHTAEVEVAGDDIAGIGVHIAARAGSAAAPGSTYVTRTVRDLVAGSGLELADRGPHALKGIEEAWQLYEVSA